MDSILVVKSLTWSGFPLQGRRKIQGMDISIENRKGSMRRGTDKDGHKWATKMNADYGYIRGTVGKDKDHLDCYVGPNPESTKVFVIHQNDPATGKYDEDKTMLGFDSAEEAKALYLKQYDRPGFFGSMDETDIETFKAKAFADSAKGKRLVIKAIGNPGRRAAFMDHVKDAADTIFGAYTNLGLSSSERRVFDGEVQQELADTLDVRDGNKIRNGTAEELKPRRLGVRFYTEESLKSGEPETAEPRKVEGPGRMITEGELREASKRLVVQIERRYPDELAVGIKVEMEHTDDPEAAKMIAIAHISQDKDYYKKLLAAGLVDEKEAIDTAEEVGLEKARRSAKLFPKRVWVTRDGSHYETTVWVLPEELQSNETHNAQLDMFAELVIDDAERKKRLVSGIAKGTKVLYSDADGKEKEGIITNVSGANAIMEDGSKVGIMQIREIVGAKSEADVHSAIARATPENRNAVSAEVFGASLKHQAPKYEYSPKETETEHGPVVDYSDVVPVKIALVPSVGIMDRPRPSWLPEIRDESFRRSGNRLDAIKVGDNDYIVALGENKYARMGIDVLAAAQDYYLKRAKAIMAKKNAETKRLFPGQRVRLHSVRVLAANRATYTSLDMARDWLFATGSKRFNPVTSALSDMKQKLADMNIQLEENYSAYAKGQETAYGDRGVKKDLLDSHGVLVKRQNGDPITKQEIDDIRTALDSVFSVYGDRSSMARSFGLKISHSGKVLMHARNAAGIYSPYRKAIGVTMKSGPAEFGFTLSHEWAHFMDHYLGTKGERFFYASDDWASLAGKIAREFRRNMTKAQLSDYQNRTCECFARAFEQYFAHRMGQEDDYQKVRNTGGNHPSVTTFKSAVEPMINTFFQENNELLKSLIGR
ncbi:MAG: hypothetical protein SAMD01599839_07960 [Rectinema sp.]